MSDPFDCIEVALKDGGTRRRAAFGRATLPNGVELAVAEFTFPGEPIDGPPLRAFYSRKPGAAAFVRAGDVFVAKRGDDYSLQLHKLTKPRPAVGAVKSWIRDRRPIIATNTVTGARRIVVGALDALMREALDSVMDCAGPCECRIEPDGVCSDGWPTRARAAGLV